MYAEALHTVHEFPFLLNYRHVMDDKTPDRPRIKARLSDDLTEKLRRLKKSPNVASPTM